jgi:hypothetical protein
MKTRWMVLLLALVCLTALAFLLLRPRGAQRAEIWLDGVLVETVDLASLTEEREIRVNEHVTVLAAPGKVRIKHSDCPDKLCERMGWSSSPAKPLICLPNRVTVVVAGGGEESDAVLR